MTDPRDQLAELPAELLAEILEYLDDASLIICMMVCRKLKDTIDNSPLIRYNFALDASGMSDGQDKSLPIAERTRRLEAYTSAWRTLDWSSTHVLNLPGKLTRGMSGGILVAHSGRTVHLYRPPSPLRGVEGRSWEFTFDFAVTEVTIDQSQDLLAVFSFDSGLHLRSLWSGEPHPDAARTEWRDVNHGIGTVILGRHLGFDSRGVTFVYDWRTDGDKEIFCTMFDGSFCFLDDDHILDLSANYNPGSLSLLVYEYSAPEEFAMVPLLALHLPAFREKIRERSGGITPQFEDTATGQSLSGHFSSKNSVRVFRLGLGFEHLDWGENVGAKDQIQIPDLELAVLSTAFTALIPSARASVDRSKPLEVFWDEWAPGKALFTLLYNSRLIRRSNGYDCRLVDLGPFQSLQTDAVEILDFHPRRVASAAKAGVKIETITGCLKDDWLAPDSQDVFVDTFLRYTTASYSLPDKAKFWHMLAEDALIADLHDMYADKGADQVDQVRVLTI